MINSISGYQMNMFGEGDGFTRSGSELSIEPLDATFKDNSRAPLHSWFPYLEGYSPRFVDRVRIEYLSGATRILEPFAGSGTTPIALCQRGITCAYSEANPAMVFVAQTKLAVLGLSERERWNLSKRLISLSGELTDRLLGASPDLELIDNYHQAFGSSIFFDEGAFHSILRLRALNDVVSEADKILGDCLSIAVLSSLIPSSKLKRAGDLRYRTAKELAMGLPDPIDLVRARLQSQARDILVSEPLKAPARFACYSASALHENSGDDWDGVITSPPYLNGTNYIRNARLELWYLRCITENADLRRLRDKVITSGINDVHANTKWDPITAGVERVVKAIQASAYDSRIAKMIGGYFHDMSMVFESLGKCLRPGARLCVDIGDSIYNGVHVPTDDLLVEVAEAKGYKNLERVHLRKRISKGGESVRQQLLVFELPKKLNTANKPKTGMPKTLEVDPKSRPKPEWRSEWEAFKKTLPHQLMPYSKRDWGGPAHSMCSYQGKMKPALAYHLVNCFSAPGDVVLDPFSGAGTIPLEACRMGRRGYGIDISRLGHVLTLAKVAKTAPGKIEELLNELEASIKEYRLEPSEIERAAEVRFNSAIPDYFHAETLREVIAARSFFLSRWDSGAEWAVLFSCTLHLLHGNRPYALSRRSHPVTPFKPTGDFEHRELMPRLRDKLARLHEELTNDVREWGGSAQGDCTVSWPESIPTADVIITSPPFFDSTRFYMTNWMRFWFAGWEREDFDIRASEFLETRQKQNLDVYHSFYAAARERLRAGGLLVLHLGNSAKCDMGAELSKRVAPWFSVADVFTEGVEHCESHGIRDKGTVHGHTYLVLEAI
jgi:DNA modification methylase